MRRCPMCAHPPEGEPVHEARHTLANKVYVNRIWLCACCELVFASSEPEFDASALYGKEWHALPSSVELKNRISKNADRVEQFRHRSQGDRTVFDAGCCRGEFLDAMWDRGWQTWGCEPDDRAYDQARDRGHSVVLGTLEAVAETWCRQERPRVWAVTLIHVLEHSPDPIRMLQAARSLLQPGGLLFIATPDIYSWGDGDTIGEPFDLRHRVFFAISTLTVMLRISGFIGLSAPIQRENGQLIVTTRRYDLGGLQDVLRERILGGIERRRENAVAVLRKHAGRPLALYGAGAHADDLMRYVIPDAEHWVSRVADGQEVLWGQEFWNRRIESPAEFRADPPPLILIASKAYQEEIHLELMSQPELKDTTLVRLYRRGGLSL